MQKKHRIKVSKAHFMKLQLIKKVMKDCIEKGIEDWPPYKDILRAQDLRIRSL